MQFLSIFNKYKVLAAQYLGDAMGHFPFRYTFIFVVRYQFQFAINLRHQCRLVPALMGRGNDAKTALGVIKETKQKIINSCESF